MDNFDKRIKQIERGELKWENMKTLINLKKQVLNLKVLLNTICGIIFQNPKTI